MKILVLYILGLSVFSAGAGLPLTDLVFFGRVNTKDTRQPITGNLPGPITVKLNSQVGLGDPLIAKSILLFDANGQETGIRQYFVLRLHRFQSGAFRGTNDNFVMPGDRIRIFLNNVEVIETESAQVLVTDAASDVRFMSLNQPADLLDSDGDGLPDAWERLYLGNLSSEAGDDANGDGVSLFVAFALGLNPNSNNASKMPFLALEAGGTLVFYFRQSTENTALAYDLKASNLVGDGPWISIPGISPQQIAIDGNSRILRAVIPGGVDRPHRFFRLELTP